MNWIFGAYSSVYNTAMMNGPTREQHAATAEKVDSKVARLFGRG